MTSHSRGYQLPQKVREKIWTEVKENRMETRQIEGCITSKLPGENMLKFSLLTPGLSIQKNCLYLFSDRNINISSLSTSDRQSRPDVGR